MRGRLRSPVTGADLRPDTAHSLAEPGRRWPVIDSIPYLRTGRDPLVADVLAHLDHGDREGGLVRLLADQDDWWDGAPPETTALRTLVRDADRLSLRDAMAHLAYGRVGDYFAYRWSDPTFMAGLGLVEAHWSEPASAFELACGIGHHLRELQLRGVAVGGADVVFSKLWLARHWVLDPGADLVCFDAAEPWPIIGRRFDLVLCQDAFYFLEPKGPILAGLRSLAGEAGTIAVGHIHNRESANLSPGASVTADEIAALFPDAVVYDDAELTGAVVAGRAPVPRSPGELRKVEAFSVAAGPGLHRQPRALCGPLTMPLAGTRLRRNPLYAARDTGSAAIAWPSERYRDEYAASATFPDSTRLPAAMVTSPAAEQAVRRRELVDLPERW